MTQTQRSINWRKVTESKLFFPILALSIILLLDLIFVPNFFSFQVRDGNLYGSLIDIMRNASPVMLISLGMTLVLRHRRRGSLGGRGDGDCGFGGGGDDEPGHYWAGAAARPDEIHQRPKFHLFTAVGSDRGYADCSDNLRAVERRAGGVCAHPADGCHADFDHRRARHCPVDHQRCAHSNILRAVRIFGAGMDRPAVFIIHCGFVYISLPGY